MTVAILGIKEIKERLPYRYPMLMVDRVKIENENKLIGLKNLCFNELFFLGHYPNHPIMPGVLQIEAMKQVSHLAAAERLDPSGEQDIYIKILEKVKFRKPNNPGDRIQIEAQVIDFNGSEAVIEAKTVNNAGVTCQARITLAARPKTFPEAMPELYNEYDKTPNVAMDVVKIMSLVPHRYPFLLIDNIISISGDDIVAVKNISYNEEFFQGYKPDYPVLPESLQAEIIAQAGCASIMSRPENAGKIPYFMSIDKAEYFHPVFPGDQLVCKLTLPSSQSRFGKGSGSLWVGDKKVSSVAMMFAIVAPE